MKKYLPLLLLGFFFFAFPAHAAITFDVSSTKAFSGLSQSTTSITIGSGSNEMLIIQMIAGNNSIGNASASVDGVPATLAASTNNGTKYVYTWYAPNISAGTHVVSSSWTLNALQGSITADSFFGITQSSPVDSSGANFASAGINMASSSVTTTVAGDLIIDGVAHQTIGATTAMGGLQSAIIWDGGGSSVKSNASYYITNTIGKVSSSYTFGNSNTWDMLDVAFKAASNVVNATNANFNLMTTGLFNTSNSTFQANKTFQVQ